MNFKKQIFAMARQDIKTLVFPEAGFSDKIIKAVKSLIKKHLIKAILIGDESALYLRYSSLENEDLRIINPKTSELKNEFAEQLFSLQKHKGMTKEFATNLVEDPYYFSTFLVKNNYADALISGSESFNATTLKPALEIIKGVKQDSLLSTTMLYVGKNRMLKNRAIMVSDCALIENPTAEDLVVIAKYCADFWKILFIDEPKIAFLSYSTNGSAESPSIEKMQTATKLFKQIYPDIVCDGEMQLDCAINSKFQEKKFPDSKIKGDANILIVPDINSGNILGNSIQYISGLMGIGPISLGFVSPISCLSRSCTIDEIIFNCVITAIQSQT